MKGRWRIAEWRRTYTPAATVWLCAVLAAPVQQNVSIYSLIKIAVPFQSGFTASYRTAYRDFSLGFCFLTLTFTDMGFWIIHTHTGAWKHNPCCPTPPPLHPPSTLPLPSIITSPSSYKSSLARLRSWQAACISAGLRSALLALVLVPVLEVDLGPGWPTSAPPLLWQWQPL